MNSLDHEDPSYKSIVHEYFCITSYMFEQYTRFFAKYIYPVLKFSHLVAKKYVTYTEVNSALNEKVRASELPCAA